MTYSLDKCSLKTRFIIAAVLVIAGSLLTIGSALQFKEVKEFLARAQKTIGTVNNITPKQETCTDTSGDGPSRSYSCTKYHASVTWLDAQGKSHLKTFKGENPDSYRLGQTLNLLYDPLNLENVKKDSQLELWGLPGILLFFGFIFAAVGLVIGYFAYTLQQMNQWLQLNGQRIKATFMDVATDYEYDSVGRINNRSYRRRTPYYQVRASWTNPRTRAVHIFSSAWLAADLSTQLEGKTVDVLIDPEDPERYVVDNNSFPTIVF